MKEVYAIVMAAGKGFHDSEHTEPYKFFEEKGLKIDVVTCYKAGDEEIKGADGTPLSPTIKLADLRAENFDAIAVIGGYEGASRLRRNPELRRFLGEMMKQRKIIGMICHGPWVACSNADLFTGRTMTCYSDMQDDLVHAGIIYREQPVVIDGNLITSPSPREAVLWAQTIYEELTSKLIP